MRKSNNTSSNNSGGVGFVGLLTILFIALKLTNVIKWSWLWVLSPVWITSSIVIVVLIIAAIVISRKNYK